MMTRWLRPFGRDERGNVAMIFALAAVPLITAVGAVVDYSRAVNLQSQLQSDTDAAALAACKSAKTATTDLKQVAQDVLNGYRPGITILDPFTVTNNPRSIEMKTSIPFTPQFMKFMNSRTITTSASCAAGENFYEIALVLDTTGSMLNSSGTGTKLDALKTAAKNFVETMFTISDAAHVKMSIVPFAAFVKVNPTSMVPATGSPVEWVDTNGRASYHWQNVLGVPTGQNYSRLHAYTYLKNSNSAWSWAGCLESLPYPWNTKDEAPTTTNYDTIYVPSFAPDEVGSRKSNGEQDVTSNNNYMDDGTATSGTCNKFDANQSTRLGQMCKYLTPTNVRTSQKGPNWGCTSRPVTPLTNEKSKLISEIDALAAEGNTNIHQGIHWGWRTVSPNGVFAGPQAYGAKNVTKIIILMSDGENTWNYDSANPVTRSDYSAYGYVTNADGSKPNNRLRPADANPNSSATLRQGIDNLTTETCSNARDKSVVIYSVAFSTSSDPIDAQGQAVLKGCAGTDDRYFLASNASSLNSTFEAIAKGIGALRITK